ncbi:MAG: helix-turn-helix transcriptional regulator [candidate division Zixibacteria bacterium]|nr:helix-turn-helix transcriptional regulator [candidate division Zixibacteria bacterium]
MGSIDIRELRAELVRKDMTLAALALSLGIRPSTFSSYARGINPAPPDLRQRVEAALGLRRGTLKDTAS